MVQRQSNPSISYDAVMLFWRAVTQIFFREVRPRGAFNIPRHGPIARSVLAWANCFLLVLGMGPLSLSERRITTSSSILSFSVSKYTENLSGQSNFLLQQKAW